MQAAAGRWHVRIFPGNADAKLSAKKGPVARAFLDSPLILLRGDTAHQRQFWTLIEWRGGLLGGLDVEAGDQVVHLGDRLFEAGEAAVGGSANWRRNFIGVKQLPNQVTVMVGEARIL